MGSALSVMDTRPPGEIVGVVPEPASTWLGLTRPESSYRLRQTTCGRPFVPAPKRYIALSQTT